ncbi:MAG: BatD family protein [Thiotrichaceae bacterium]|nr:BatD family protein [Thiotrichaceae bacterium]
MVKGLICIFWLFCTVAWAADTPLASVKLSTEQVWQREQLIIRVFVPSDDEFAKLRVDDFKQEGFVISPVLVTKTANTLIAKWVVFPFVDGKKTLYLPRIRYHPNRGSLKTLSLSNPMIDIKKLPLYVPATMPVGKITLSHSWQEGRLVTANHLFHWPVVVLGHGVAEQSLPKLSRQIHSDEYSEVFPAKIELSTAYDEEGGLVHRQISIIPMKALEHGFLNLPTLHVQFFNPKEGKLQFARLEPPWAMVLSQFSQGFIAICLLIFTVLALYWLIRMTKKILTHYFHHQEALALISSANNYQRLRIAFVKLARVKGWSHNLTLSECLNRYHYEYGVNEALAEKVCGFLESEFTRSQRLYPVK